MATKAEVRNRAASDLGLRRLGQALQDQNKVRIEEAYDEVYADLKVEGLATWTSTGAIPAEVVPHVVALVADNCLGTYGVSIDRYNRIKAVAGDISGPPGWRAKKEIRRIVGEEYDTSEEATDY